MQDGHQKLTQNYFSLVKIKLYNGHTSTLALVQRKQPDTYSVPPVIPLENQQVSRI